MLPDAVAIDRCADDATRAGPLVRADAARVSSSCGLLDGMARVAYDMPDMRSAFGVAGSGADAWSPDVYQGWPYKTVYADGSRAGYGLEGGTGTNWLAYIQIPGQQCLYNVWSRRGREHLEQLLGQIRFVGM